MPWNGRKRRIAELERNVETERYRREVAESVLEDPQLMHQLNVEIERLQSALSDRERELEEIAARGEAAARPREAGAPESNGTGVDPEQLSELEGKVAVYEIELLELRARLEDVVDREFADLRESELKQEIERLGAELAAAGDAPVAEEQLAPLREALAAAQDARDQAHGPRERAGDARRRARGRARGRARERARSGRSSGCARELAAAAGAAGRRGAAGAAARGAGGGAGAHGAGRSARGRAGERAAPSARAS